ncbi:nucleotidyltransferase domain-containing protein [Bacillus sp. B15-48]|uniref:nucleotidyltransferase domain-containing protein n=1 Tax=Bacillus sp. B15-48 TaxID=1548601 RepID=UPI00193FFAB5|nr:nucleotidyltransferase domain-containing protein [Bacillus sp. B15-48]MBM4763090.1 nucleotidyltransferase domain-containing protein [Bacillus sp. B15-48]
MKMPEKTAARNFLQQSFPHCEVAFLAGSGASGELTEHSDLDIVILDESQSASFRQCFFCFGWKIEAFVYNRMSLSFAFEMSRLEGIPSILRMCAEGIILKDDGSAAEIQDIAKEYIRNGPSELTEEKLQYMRFTITDLLDDLNSYTDDKEKIFVVYKLFDFVSEFILRANGHWIGYGKWLYRSLLHFDKDFCERYVEVFHIFMKTGNSMPLSTLIDKVLEPYGGRLFEGYKEPL